MDSPEAVLGYKLEQERLDHIYKNFLVLADSKKDITDEDLQVLVGHEKKEKRILKLDKFQVICGKSCIPSATVTINHNGRVMTRNAIGDGPVDEVTPEQILSFLNRLTKGNKPYTKRIRFSQLSSFFNFIRNNIDLDLRNPCDTPMIRKLYRERVPLRWEIIEKETIDEIIFRTTKVRNRLILELMARGGMRIGEVLKLRLGDLQDRKLILREPKSGKEYEFVFIPQKVADRLREYAQQVCNVPSGRIFPISYEAARIMVIKSGKLVGVKLRPHDLRRHSATYASTYL